MTVQFEGKWFSSTSFL